MRQLISLQSATTCYYKVRQLNLLQGATTCYYFIIKYSKCYYKVRQVLQSATVLLQSATGITKCDGYYKVRQNREHIGKDHIEKDPVRSNYSKTMERGQEGKKLAAGAAERDFSDISFVQI